MTTTEQYSPSAARESEVERLRRRVAALSEDNRRLRRRERLMRTAVESGGLGLWIVDPAARKVEGSPAFKAGFGRAPDDPLVYDDLLAQMQPEDRARREAVMAESIATGRDYHMEYRVTWPNGEERDLEIRGAPVFNERRRLAGLAGVSLDVTPRKRAEARDQLVREELSHRLKNCMTTVAALASQTLRTSDGPESFRTSFGARLEALGRSLTMVGDDEPRTLGGVLLRALAPYVEASADRFAFDGPDVPLPERSVTALGLVAHELATNAMKYGALSTPEGRVLVAWTVEDGRVALTWREVGGPPVTTPSRRGFGSRLIERAAPMELDGSATVEFAPDGVVCRIAFPLRG